MTPFDPNDPHKSSSPEAPEESARSSQSSQEDPTSQDAHQEPSAASPASEASAQSSQADSSSHEDTSFHSSTTASSEASSQEDRSSRSAHSARKERAERNAYDAVIIKFLSEAIKLNKKIAAKDLCIKINKKLPPNTKPLTVQMLAAIKIRLRKQGLLPLSSQTERPDHSSHTEQSDREDSKVQKERSVGADRSAQKERETREEPSDSSWQEELSARFASFPNLPKRKRDGRKENRDAKKVTLTLDKNLHEIIEAEADRRAWEVATTIEWLIWNFCGRPPLTYSPPEPVQEPMAEPEPETVKAEPERKKRGRKPKETKTAEEPKAGTKGRGGRRKKTP